MVEKSPTAVGPPGYLRDVQVVEFLTDHAYTIRNAAFARRLVRSVASQLAKDEDGACVDVILYEAEMGEFGELEFIRLDTRPLLAIPGMTGRGHVGRTRAPFRNMTFGTQLGLSSPASPRNRLIRRTSSCRTPGSKSMPRRAALWITPSIASDRIRAVV